MELETESRRSMGLGAVRWDWWMDRKQRWVRDPEPQLEEGIFRAIAAGTGLPPILERALALT